MFVCLWTWEIVVVGMEWVRLVYRRGIERRPVLCCVGNGMTQQADCVGGCLSNGAQRG